MIDHLEENNNASRDKVMSLSSIQCLIAFSSAKPKSGGFALTSKQILEFLITSAITISSDLKLSVFHFLFLSCHMPQVLCNASTIIRLILGLVLRVILIRFGSKSSKRIKYQNQTLPDHLRFGFYPAHAQA